MDSNYIALDLAIIPEVGQWVYDFNSQLFSLSRMGPLFSVDCLPHITLFQGFIERRELNKLESLLEEMISSFLADAPQIKALSIQKGGEFISGFSSYGVEISKKDNLLKLQKEIHSISIPKVIDEEDEKIAFSFPEINDSTRKYVRGFKQNNSDVNYNPHLSLGIAEKERTINFPEDLKFPLNLKIKSIVLSHMGNFCTVTSKNFKTWI
jgi:hypothetical protein